MHLSGRWPLITDRPPNPPQPGENARSASSSHVAPKWFGYITTEVQPTVVSMARAISLST
jgi:hypothetical protein